MDYNKKLLQFDKKDGIMINKYMKGIMEKPIEKPNHPCWNCGGTEYYQHFAGGAYICCVCHPPVSGIKIITE